jgi:PIN domain nuclease of toxin-antitoxin system
LIVLDTHVWVWWAAEPRKLSPKARRAIEEAPELGVCAISCWEVAMLVARDRLALDRAVSHWVRQALALPKVVSLPLTPEIAVRAAAFDASVPGDPADRMIVATALHHHAPVVTKDKRIQSFREVHTVW